jgi:hypothetical protein
VLDSIENVYEGGYHFITMSKSWRAMCRDMPDSPRVVIPPVYATAWIDLPDDDLVIQAWKGNCPHIPGLPGGIGGEVGVYRREPGRKLEAPRVIPEVDKLPVWERPLARRAIRWLLRRAQQIVDEGEQLWWPVEDSREPIAMSFAYDGQTFFAANQPDGYWLSRWMTYASYLRFAAAKRHVPAFARDFEMQFSVGAREFIWGDRDGGIKRLR